MFIAYNGVPEALFVAIGETEEEAVGKMRAFLAERNVEEDCCAFWVGRLSENGTIDLDNVSDLQGSLELGACRGDPSKPGFHAEYATETPPTKS